MKTKLLILSALLLGALAFWATAWFPVDASARIEDGHDHDTHGKPENLDDLFAEEEENAHRGHDHGAHEDDSKGHDDHADHKDQGQKEDDHVGHNHGPGDGDCPEHRIPEAEDALCQPQLMETLRPGQGLMVRLETPEAAERAGVNAARPVPADMEGQGLPAQVVFNRNRLARLTPLVPGQVKKVKVGLGQKVAAGQVLAEIASPEIAALRASLQTARNRVELNKTTFEREKELLAKGVTSRQEFEQAKTDWLQAKNALAQASQQLSDYGLEPGDLQGNSGSLLPVRAPFAGTVIELSAVTGESVAQGSPLFILVDLETMWLELSVPENRMVEILPELKLHVSFTALPGRAFEGKIFWVSPVLDEKTRMLKALAEVDNSSALLRSGLFGEVRINGATSAESLAVPADALQVIDGAPFVFIELESDLYELRRVDAGRRNGRQVVIARGLAPEDRVVSTQGFSLKSEILKSRLGASCADH